MNNNESRPLTSHQIRSDLREFVADTLDEIIFWTKLIVGYVMLIYAVVKMILSIIFNLFIGAAAAYAFFLWYHPEVRHSLLSLFAKFCQ